MSETFKLDWKKTIAGSMAACALLIGGVTVYRETFDALQKDEVFSEYLKFVSTYGKAYQTSEEFQFRKAIFAQNYKRIVDHNAIPDSGFELEVNQFADLTDEEFVSTYAQLKVPKEKTEALKGTSVPIVEAHQARSLSELPPYMNWYKRGVVTRPYDQGSCGGCWAFSAVSTVETMAYMNGLDKELTEYSVMQLLECDPDNYACTGGWMY